MWRSKSAFGRPKTSSNWRDAQRGRTYTQIASVFNVTRHAVAGILFRKFPTLRAPSKPRHVVRKAKPPKPPKVKVEVPPPKIPLKGAIRTGMTGDFGGWEEREALRLHRRLFDPGDPLPLMHLGRCQCRYAVIEDKKVLGGWLFCAQPTSPKRAIARCTVKRFRR